MRNSPLFSSPADAGPERPTLDLSGPALRSAFESLVSGSEQHGGIERYVDSLRLKAALFQQTVGDGKAADLSENAFLGLCAFMGPVRRRVSPRLEEDGFLNIRAAIIELLDGASDTATADSRIRRFCARFPDDRKHRWVRDLAAELLHYSHPERYPLMCRWVWDARTNTGVLREVWYGENVDHMVIDVSDEYQSFLVLREELSQFLTDNGVFRDTLYYVDLLCAQIYAGYISSQGGTYLRTDFSSPDDPMQYARRLLGLDGVNARTGRTRVKTIDGAAFVLEDAQMLERH